jgi:hypothetical protein
LTGVTAPIPIGANIYGLAFAGTVSLAE